MKTQGTVIRNTRERRQSIIDMLQKDHQVSVVNLSQEFLISEVSIRRDLDYLASVGVAERTHGGARLSPAYQQGTAFNSRLLEDVASKRAIGREAARLIKPGDTILLDSGTSVLEVARNIPRALLEKSGLTVVTRSLAIASELHRHRNLRLLVLGGMYLHEYDDFVGAQVENALQGMHVSTLFIGTEGITLARGLTSDNLLEAGLYQRLASISDRVVVVASSIKFGVDRLQTLLPIDKIDILITDNLAPKEMVSELREHGVETLIVSREGP
jgi:DeoR/GlpR family transcriptional regulator of sugar metabolism